MLKTPKFWYQETKAPPVWCKVLSFVYYAVSKFYRSLQKSRKISKPVICVGNITLGGSGKTPLAIAVYEILREFGKSPHFLTRGYGGNIKDVVLVDIERHSYLDVGDEPLILAARGKTWVSKNRFKGAIAAVKCGADCIVMDDGLQNFTLRKDISIMVIDATIGLGNNHIFPSGPLRESLADGTKRVNLCVILNADAAQKEFWTDRLEKVNYSGQILFADTLLNRTNIVKDKIVAFAGIAVPDKFKRSLENAGLKVVKFYEFPDHHKYAEDEIEDMLSTAQSYGLELVTTEKDFVKLPAKFKSKVKLADIVIAWQDVIATKEFFRKQLKL